MKTKIRIVLWALTLIVLAWRPVQAADSASSPATGRVLILVNERILEGDIEKVGDRYRIRRIVGETWVPGEQVLCLCRNLEEALVYLRTRANLRDADERMRLARWCQLHGLRAQALEEAIAAVELRPNHPESLHLLRCLQRSAAVPAPAQTSQPADKAEAVSNPAPALDLSSEALGLFTSRVQPILMNTCATCHAAGRGGNFKLARVFEESLANGRATQQNLAAVLGQINRDRPQASPLLTRAVSVHGDADPPPLKGRQTAAYRILEDWVRMTVADTPVEEGPAPVASLATPEARPFAEVAPKPEPGPATPAPVSTSTLDPKNGSAANFNARTPAPGSTDPFDPAIFNRQMHPSPGSGN